MKKLLNLMLVVAFAIGFASCEQTELSDSKYEKKLEGEWSVTTINGTLMQDGVVLQEHTVNIPDGEMLQSVVFNFKKNGVLVETLVSADGEKEVEEANYSVADGKVVVYYEDEEPVELDIVDISNKNLTLKSTIQYSSKQDAIVEIHFVKL